MKNGEKNKAIRVAIEVKLSLFTLNLILHFENKNTRQKLTDLIALLDKKANIQKNQLYYALPEMKK